MKLRNRQRRQDASSNRTAMLWLGVGAVALVTALILWGFAPVQGLATASGYFSGQVNGAGNMSLRLSIDGTNVTGAAILPGAAISSRLEGQTRPSGGLLFSSIGNREDYDQTNGVFSGTITGTPAVFNGQWVTNGGRPISVKLDQIAVIRTVRWHTGFHIRKYGGTKDFEAVLPVFTSPLSFYQDINRILFKATDADAAEYTGEGLQHALEGVRNPGSANDYDAKDITELVYFSNRIVSLHELDWAYTGGAHGNSGNFGQNFLLAGGTAHEIALAELFEPATDWAARISDLCLADLKQQEASSVKDGSITNLPPDSLNNFNVSPAGLVIYFDPYAVGSYAEGTYTVILPWQELSSCLRTNGPASLLTK